MKIISWLLFIRQCLSNKKAPDQRLITRLTILLNSLTPDHELYGLIEAALEVLARPDDNGLWQEPLYKILNHFENIQQFENNDQKNSNDSVGDELLLIRSQEILSEYQTESIEHFEKIEQAVLKLEANRQDGEDQDIELVNQIFRAFHSMKGTAGFLGYTRIQKLAHQAEQILQKARDGHLQVDHSIDDLILKSADMLNLLIQDIRPQEPLHELVVPVGYDELIRYLEHDFTQKNPVPDKAVAQLKAPGTVSHAVRRVESIRVNVQKMDLLMNTIGELVIIQSMLAEDSRKFAEHNSKIVRNLAQLGKISRNLQDISLSLRMVPLRGLLQKSERAARDLSRRFNKPIQITILGEETEIDRNMVEMLSDPLVHMIRNALDHGIEDKETRLGRGKPETGSISLKAYHSTGYVYIEVQDDGRGLDREKILAKAMSLGLVHTESDLTDQEVFQYILKPGFSTAEKLTDISGRGVGMDVVKQNIGNIQGRVEISSQPGEWTKFTIQIPLTLAIIDGLLLRVGYHEYIVPTLGIIHIWRPEARDISTVNGKGEMVLWRNRLMPIYHLHRLLGIEGAKTDPTKGLLLLCEDQSRYYALLIDELLGQQQFVIKSFDQSYSTTDAIAGAAVLGDGRIRLVLDALAILEMGRHLKSSAELLPEKEVEAAAKGDE